MFLLSEEIVFPPVHLAEADGLLAIGGDLSTERLLLAYRSGVFPWYNPNEVIQWWCPNPRFVLYPNELKISKSMKQLLRNNTFTYTYNTTFTQVMENCKTVSRRGELGTWISKEIIESYTQLYNKGVAISAEAWSNNELVGGLYGVRMGNLFFGESMFSKQSNASKFTFIKLVQQLQAEGVVLIDCQVYTAHLESLGAKMIDRNDFMNLLAEEIE
jgi:leucyl/phenylalanyl-tRNA---protein transferase